MNKKNKEGLLSKNTRLNRYLQIRAVGSRSDGSDRIGPRSNRDRWARIGGPWEFGRVGRQRDSPERGSAAASSPEQAKTALPCMVCPGIWPRSSRMGRVVHLRAQDGGLELGTACAAVGRASAAAPAVVRACALCGARVRVLESPRPCAEPRANPGGVRAWLCGSRHGELGVRRRGCTGVATF